MHIIKAGTGERFSDLLEAFSLSGRERACISFVGAGGKTTILYRLAQEFAEEGKRVIVTTTTHMEKPQTAFFPWKEHHASLQQLKKHVKESSFLTVGVPCIHHGMEKIKGAEQWVCQEFLTMADVLLIEADGSRRMPVKIPSSHEPLVPEWTDVTIAVLGYPAIGKPIECCAYRPEELADFLGKDKEHRLNLKDVSAIWEKDGGARKGMKGRKLFVLNQCPKEEATTLLAHFKDKREIYLCEKEERP